MECPKESPYGCDLPRFSAKDFLARLRGKKPNAGRRFYEPRPM